MQKIKETIYKAMIFFLIIILSISAYNIFKISSRYLDSRKTYGKVSKAAQADPNNFKGNIDFKALKKINPDVQTWIYQKNTVINYPIVKAKDNNKYLHTMFNGKYGIGGTLFVDARNEDFFNGFNTIIYGHHMRDGSMFRSLRGYIKEKGYYESHKTFELITEIGKYHLFVFSAYITPSDSDVYKTKFIKKRDKKKFINMLKQSSEIKADDIDVDVNERTVTLSTCAYDYANARYVVACKMIPWNQKEIAAQ